MIPGMINKPLAMGLALALALGACTEQDKRLAFDGQYFRAKSAMVDKDNREHFVVTVHKPGQSLSGARQAGAHEGTYYCIRNFGTSRIKWTAGPDVPDAGLTLDKGVLTFTGECNP